LSSATIVIIVLVGVAVVAGLTIYLLRPARRWPSANDATNNEWIATSALSSSNHHSHTFDAVPTTHTDASSSGGHGGGSDAP
jgi:hypothetical protein